MVHFMGFSNGSKVGVFGIAEPIEPSVNEHIVHQEITQSVGGDPGPDPKAEVGMYAARNEAPRAGDCENQEEGIVLFEKSRLVLVMVAVEIPHDAVHEVFVRSPCNTFHDQKGAQHNQKGGQNFHGNSDSPIKKAVCRISNNPAARLVRKVWALRHAHANPKAMIHQLM